MAFRHLVHVPQAQDRNKEQQEGEELFGKPQMFVIHHITDAQDQHIQGKEESPYAQCIGQDLLEEIPGAPRSEPRQGAEHEYGESRQQDPQDFPVEGKFDFFIVSASPFFFLHAVPFLKIFICWLRFP